MFRSRSYIDVWIALAVAVLAGCTAVYSYALIREYESDQFVLFSGLRKGTSRHFLRSGGVCVGMVSADFGQTDSALLTGELQLRLRAGGGQAVSTSTFELHFNPLGQMHLGRVIIDSPGIRGVVQSERVKPVMLSANLVIGEKKFDHTLSLAGPIELEQKGEQFRIVMPSRKQTGPSVTESILSALLPEIEIRPETAGSVACDQSGALDLDAISRRVSGPIQQLLGAR